MKFKLAIGNIVDVPVDIMFNDGADKVRHEFVLHVERGTAAQLRQDMADDKVPAVEVIAPRVRGWRGQRLVLDQDDNPVEFSAEALEELMSAPGLAVQALTVFLEVAGASRTLPGRAKN